MSDNLQSLEQEFRRVYSLIEEANKLLHPSEHVTIPFPPVVGQGLFGEGGSFFASLIASAGQLIHKGIEKRTAYQQAQKSMVPLYQELAVKQEKLLIEKERAIERLNEKIQTLSDDRAALELKIKALEDLISRISAAIEARTA